MRCRYCGKELALLKRLTGGGEFCSDAHKQSYQDEYNRLALSRLLQAQKVDIAEPPVKKAATPLAEPVAIEEPAANPRVEESLPIEIRSLEPSAAENHTGRGAPVEPQAEPDPEPRPEPDTEPLEMADFLTESPATAALLDETPYLEPWLEFSSGPAVADWQLQERASTLSAAQLLSLDLRPHASPAEHPVAPPNLTLREFTNGHGQPTLPWKVTTMHELPSAGPFSIEVAASAIDFAADRSIAPALGFETAILIEDSQLLVLPSTGIEFPGEDSAVVVALRQNPRGQDPRGQDSFALDDGAAAVAVENDSPRASLEALSRLHQDLVQQEEAAPEESPVLEAAPAPVAEDEPIAGEPTPGRATGLLDIPIRMFPPAKPAPTGSAALPSESEPLLPHLKSLPLRPQVAVASGYVPPSSIVSQPAATAGAPQPAPSPPVPAQPTAPQPTPRDALPSAPSKPAPAVRPVARIPQPKQPQAQTKASSSAKTEPSKPAAKSQPPSPVAATLTAPPSPVGPEADATEPALGASAKAAGQPAKPVAEEAVKEVAKPAAKQPIKQPRSEPAREPVPNFGAVQLANPSFLGSLKVKLGIAITLVVVACSTWLGWGGMSRKPAAPNATISGDGSGPSIIMGEGGWVEGWSGDPSGLHSGRQITIYRPSLKLSDYRIDFQGSIETQSIGWVFRAADPDNYYAVKLMTVSSGLSPKVALFKYLVLNGRQTQVGRVPIDLTIQADTVFHIRTDVQGPQFTTYIQGRQVDVWTDDQLKTGGVGFLNEREERGKVKSVSIRYLNGAAK
jgi:hypothetical protein